MSQLLATTAAAAAAGQSFALGTFSVAGSPPFAGLVLDGERVIAIEALRGLMSQAGHSLARGGSVLSLIECWDTAMPALQVAANALRDALKEASSDGLGDAPRGAGAGDAHNIAGLLMPLNTLKVHPPVAARQIFMCGANYFKHVVDIIVDMGPGKNPGTEGMNPQQLRAYAEALMQRRQREGTPYVFNKPVSTMSGAFDAIELPPWAEQPDWELELAVVISRAARHVHRDDAMNYVAGYTIANDITNRDWIYARADMKALGTDWLLGKSCPTYLPIGPYLVPREHAGNANDFRLELDLNGERKQDESTADMIFDIPRLIEHISGVVQLLPGDVICTGSPAGNGTHYKRFLQPGDVVDARITGLGCHRNTVVSQRS